MTSMDEDTSSNDVETVEVHEVSEESPIMLLLKCLIKNKQNTVMTNVQIINILQKEFDIDIETRHELEVDIYIKIIKKFLKDWPQWEELERVSSRLSRLKDYEAVSKVLKHKYKNLKEYLGVMLEAAKPLAQDAIQDIDDVPKDDIDTNSDVVLDVQCTRDQLNVLFHRHPARGSVSSNAIFNKTPVPPKKISCSLLPPDSILNLWCFRIGIFVNTIWFFREISYNYKHVLANHANKRNHGKIDTLEEGWVMQTSNPKNKQVSRKEILREIKDIMFSKYSEDRDLVTSVFNIIRRDLEDGPEYLKLSTLYRKYCNKYKYIRHLYKDDAHVTDTKYDLQLEETISPAVTFTISSYSKSKPLCLGDHWLVFECLLCKEKLSGGAELQQLLVNHYSNRHVHNEPSWACTNCKSVFLPNLLADNCWAHNC